MNHLIQDVAEEQPEKEKNNVSVSNLF